MVVGMQERIVGFVRAAIGLVVPDGMGHGRC